MKITNDDIISAAKSLREKQDQKLTTPQNPLTAKRSSKIWMAAAACAVGFIFGFGLRPSMMPFADGSHTAQQLTADSLQQVMTAKAADGTLPSGVQPKVVREVVHDTIVETKFVIKEIVREVPVMAKNVTVEEKKPNNNNNNERGKTVGCSMMCDNISYDLIASKN